MADLNELRAVWRAAGVYSLELEKRFTEFQIVFDAGEAIVAAFGIDVRLRDGHIHSVALAPGAAAREIRELIWQRVQALAENRGLTRLWSADHQFWREQGFVQPDEKTLRRGAELFEATMERRLTLRLREEEDLQRLAEAQFELFHQSAVAEREHILNRGRLYRNIAIGIAGLVVFGGLVAAAVFIMSRQ